MSPTNGGNQSLILKIPDKSTISKISAAVMTNLEYKSIITSSIDDMESCDGSEEEQNVEV